MSDVVGQFASPKNQVPPISSLKGELGNEAPTQMETTAMNPKMAGRRRKDQSSSPSAGSGSTRWLSLRRGGRRRRTASARLESRPSRAPIRATHGGGGNI